MVGSSPSALILARYSFKYPSEWKEDNVNKVEKGTNGTDCRLTGSLRNKEKLYVVVLARLGEDLKGYSVTDVERALGGIAVSDYELQDAISAAGQVKFTEREVNGQSFFDLNLVGGPSTYLGSLTNDGYGRYYAFFITASPKSADENKATYEKIRQSFRTFVIQ